MIYFEVLIQASNRKTELRFMVSDSRGIRPPQPGSIKYDKKRKFLYFFLSQNIWMHSLKVQLQGDFNYNLLRLKEMLLSGFHLEQIRAASLIGLFYLGSRRPYLGPSSPKAELSLGKGS